MESQGKESLPLRVGLECGPWQAREPQSRDTSGPTQLYVKSCWHTSEPGRKETIGICAAGLQQHGQASPALPDLTPPVLTFPIYKTARLVPLRWCAFL